MKAVHGQVTINEAPTKSKILRFCEKKIDQWLASHPVGFPKDVAEFRVSFTEEDETKQISCVTEILMGDKILRGCDVDVDSQAAFLHSLKHLHTAQASL